MSAEERSCDEDLPAPVGVTAAGEPLLAMRPLVRRKGAALPEGLSARGAHVRFGVVVDENVALKADQLAKDFLTVRTDVSAGGAPKHEYQMSKCMDFRSKFYITSFFVGLDATVF
jgi:hypothetical protein